MKRTKRLLALLLAGMLVIPMVGVYAEELSDGTNDNIEKNIQESVLISNDLPNEGVILSDQNESTIGMVRSSTTYFCPRSFARYSFAGMSGTDIKINLDWSFTIESHDNEMIQGEGYNGAILYTRYYGQFGEPRQLNEYSFLLPIISIKPEHENGYEHIENGILYGFYESDSYAKLEQFILYLPGTPRSVFPEPDYWIDRAIDPKTGVIREGTYLLDGWYYGTVDSETDAIPLPISYLTPAPTEIPLSNEPPEVTGYYNSVKGADIRWTGVAGAEGYRVYRSRNADGTKCVATITDPDLLQYYDGDIKDNCWGRVYVYYIIPFAGSKKGEASSKVTLQRLAPMKITDCENNSVESVDLTWACTVNENKALGYEIQFATSKEDLFGQKGSFKKVAVNGRNKLSKTIMDLIAGETYFFRVRCYVNYIHSVTGKQTKTWSQYSNIVEELIHQ